MKEKTKRPKKPAVPENRKELAYRRLLSMLTTGHLPSGIPVSEVALAKEFGISRTPIREAIGQLVAEGLLEQVAGRGTVVRQLTRYDIVELYELREALEVYAAGRVAARRLPEEELRELAALVGEVEVLRRQLMESGATSLDGPKMQRFMSLDFAFHSLILRAASNSRILKVDADSRLLIRIFAIPHDGHTAPQLSEIHRFHSEILDALAGGDSAMAQKVLAEHIQISMRERIQAFDEWERRETISRAFLERPDLVGNISLTR